MANIKMNNPELETQNSKLRTDNSFHESRDSAMDKRLPKRSFFQKYKYHLLAGAAFVAFLVFVIVSVSGGRKLRVDNEKIARACGSMTVVNMALLGAAAETGAIAATGEEIERAAASLAPKFREANRKAIQLGAEAAKG